MRQLTVCLLVAPVLGLSLWACSSDSSSDAGRKSGTVGAAGTATAATGAPGLAGTSGAAGAAGSAAGTGTNFGQAPVQPTFMEPVKPPESCARADVNASRIVPTVMLLVDGSQSMMDNCYPSPAAPDGGEAPSCNPLFDNMPSRWDAIRGALTAPDGFVSQLQGVVKFGLAVYGTVPTCPLPLGVIDPAIGNANAIIGALPVAAPGLTTPTAPALEEVVKLLPDPTQALDEIIGPQIIILATDGDPNSCDDFLTPTLEQSVAAALTAQAKHLKLYVISVGSDSSAAHLQELANIGAGMDRSASPGADVYYPGDPASLSATLMSLVGEAISCELELEGRGVKMGKECDGSIVTLNGHELECNGPDGWVLKSSTVIELQGAACEQLQGDVSAMLTANFPCDILVD